MIFIHTFCTGKNMIKSLDKSVYLLYTYHVIKLRRSQIMPNDEMVIKCEELSSSVYLRVYFDDGEPVGCEFYDERPGVLTFMQIVSLPDAIQNALIEFWHTTIMEKYNDRQRDWKERLAEERVGV